MGMRCPHLYWSKEKAEHVPNGWETYRNRTNGVDEPTAILRGQRKHQVLDKTKMFCNELEVLQMGFRPPYHPAIPTENRA